ncbi:MAG TPA: hypothetical protein ENG12_04360 [Candidatus Altiarchaeales archaeon]|nr:hypothetical protein [Candidatus Altiarchaeales archaeon]
MTMWRSKAPTHARPKVCRVATGICGFYEPTERITTNLKTSIQNLYLLCKPILYNTIKKGYLRGYLQTIILNYLSEISEKELKRLADQVKPFLFKEDDIELILKAPQYGKKFLSRY